MHNLLDDGDVISKCRRHMPKAVNLLFVTFGDLDVLLSVSLWCLLVEIIVQIFAHHRCYL